MNMIQTVSCPYARSNSLGSIRFLEYRTISAIFQIRAVRQDNGVKVNKATTKISRNSQETGYPILSHKKLPVSRSGQKEQHTARTVFHSWILVKRG